MCNTEADMPLANSVAAATTAGAQNLCQCSKPAQLGLESYSCCIQLWHVNFVVMAQLLPGLLQHDHNAAANAAQPAAKVKHSWSSLPCTGKSSYS
jgi:hypothetical protein